MKRRTLIVGLGSLAALQSRIQAAAFKDLDRAILRRLREGGAASDWHCQTKFHTAYFHTATLRSFTDFAHE
jgi:hypothetical protein